MGLKADPKDDRVQSLVDLVKQREYEGYAYDTAEASFELLARRALGQSKEFFSSKNSPYPMNTATPRKASY